MDRWSPPLARRLSLRSAALARMNAAWKKAKNKTLNSLTLEWSGELAEEQRGYRRTLVIVMRQLRPRPGVDPRA